MTPIREQTKRKAACSLYLCSLQDQHQTQNFLYQQNKDQVINTTLQQSWDVTCLALQNGKFNETPHGFEMYKGSC